MNITSTDDISNNDNIIKMELSTNDFSSLVYELSKIDKQLESGDTIKIELNLDDGTIIANTYCERKQEFKATF